MEFYLSSYFTGKALFCGYLNYPCKFFLYRLNFVSSLLDNCIGNIPTQALHYKACQNLLFYNPQRSLGWNSSLGAEN